MAYRLQDDEPIVEGLARIVLEQIDRALAEVADPQLPRPDAVHEVRKRCKKIRGLLRLARTALADVYHAEDDFFRDAARKLAGVRQAEATLAVLDTLRSDGSSALSDEVIDQVRDALAACHRHADQPVDVDARLAEFAQAMQEARQRVQQWTSRPADAGEMRDAILKGFKRAYRRGRSALEAAELVQADDYLHEFRKWAKYHWHHIKLLEQLGPKKRFRRRDKRLTELSDLLGDDRDLGALRHELLERTKAAEQPLATHKDQVDQIVSAIDQRRGSLRREAFRLAKKLYDEKPKALTGRLAKRWQ
ncbi:MAG: CHAD domain-containing protein [Aureliella sp.]